jgi:polyisoprenoid-binding protein YceI
VVAAAAATPPLTAPAEPAVPEAAVAVAPVPSAPIPAAAPAAPPKPGFLSFSLPASQFRFAEPQDYQLVAELCRVGFDAKSTLHDFTGVTKDVRGQFHADFDDPQGAWSGEILATAGSLQTGVEGRDTNMWEYLQTKEHPEIRFVIERFAPAVDGIDAGKQTVRGVVHGTMTIRGKSRALALPLAVEVDPQKRVVLTGQVSLKLSDYDVPVPSKLGVINMQDEVVVWIALRARTKVGGRK